MATCELCNCFDLGCSPNCCNFEFILNDTPVLATQDGLHILSYIQEGQDNKNGGLQFLIGDPIVFPASWFNSQGLVKFQLTLPDGEIFTYQTYTCFEFERIISTTPETSENIQCLGSNNPNDICTVCDLLAALGVSSQLLVEIRNNTLFLDTPLSQLGKEATLQDILTAINTSGGNYALESTLQLVLTALSGIALDSTLQSILTALGSGLAQETTLQTVAKETTLQAVITALSGLSTETTLGSVLTQLQNLNLVDFSTETTLQALLLAIQNLPAGGDATAANQVLEIAQLTTLNSKDFATQTTLQAVLTALGPLATQTTVGQILTELQSLNTVDFATQTTLASVLSQLNNVSLESTLQSALTQLQNLNLKDFATQTTLLAILTELQSFSFGDATAANQVLEIAELTSLNSKDFSTETTLQSVLAALLLSGQELTLQSILTALGPLATEVTLGQVLTELQSANVLLTSIDSGVNSISPYMPSFDTYLSNLNTIQGDIALIVGQLDAPISTLGTEVTLQAILTALGGIGGGDASAANQLLEIAELQSLNLKDFATESTLQGVLTALGGGLATEATLQLALVELIGLFTIGQSTQVLIGDFVETAPATDTASSGLNGRLQRIAQRLSTLINLFPTSIGQKTMANSLAVTIASNQSAIPISGTVTANAGTNLNTSALALETTQVTQNANIGATNETVALTDTATSGLNGLFKRLLQRITTLITNLGTPFQAGGSIGNTQFGATQSGSWTVTANAGTNLNTSLLATEATQTTQNTRIGDLTETAPATDTASSGLNGRLQRIAQRLTSLIALLPTSLGQKTMANSLAVTLASDQSALNVTSNTTIGTTTTQTSVTAAAALNQGSQTLIAANANRKKLVIANNTNRIIYVLIGGGTANTTTQFSFPIPVGGKEILKSSQDCDTTFAFTYSIQQATSTGTVLITSIV
jgi:hypothetical protein